MAPVLGGKVEEGKQRFPVLGQTGDRLVVLGVVLVGEYIDRCLGRRAGRRGALAREANRAPGGGYVENPVRPSTDRRRSRFVLNMRFSFANVSL